MSKRVLILAGSPYQVPLIERAKQHGHYVITCDYLPRNPGHSIANEYYKVSTTDKEAVLKLARDLRVDAVATMSSDPAVPTVAHVAASLGLPGPSVRSVEALTEKDKFRQLLSRIGLSAPRSYVVSTETVPDELVHSSHGYVVKPVDSSGSKGITYCDRSTEHQLGHAIRRALEHSRAGRCIIEEYIDGHQVHGDGYIQGGKLVYSYLGDHVFYTKTHNFIPVSTRWPSRVSPESILEVNRQVQMIVNAAEYQSGPVNIEARITRDGRVYIVEVGPRNGGNFVPLIQQRLTGFDFVERILAGALGIRCAGDRENSRSEIGAHYILHADRAGRYAGVSISDDAEQYIFFRSIFKREGEYVERFVGSNTTVGIILLRFDSIRERDDLMNAAELHFQTSVR